VGFAITGSASLFAEAVHSVADTGNQGLLLLGAKRAERAPSESHPFGYARERYFWAFVVSIVLFLGGGVFALYEGVEKLRHPHEPSSLGVAVTILVVAVVFEAFSLRTAVREARKVKDPEQSWFTFIRRSKSAELPVVLLEDVGALVGLLLALFGVILSGLTDEPRFDAMGSISIGLLLVVISFVLASEMRSLLVGEAAGPDEIAAVRTVLDRDPRVLRVRNVRTQQLGSRELLVGAEIELDPTLDGAGVGHAIEDLELQIQRVVPEATVVYLEPHSTDAAGSD
jgi:cation diffusion facilitator family transporter